MSTNLDDPFGEEGGGGSQPGRMAGDYQVGYKKPPKSSQFKKGQSGNKSGRPRRKPTHAELVKRTLDRRIELREGGKRRKITLREGLIRQLAKEAANGDLKALQWLMDRYPEPELPEEEDDLTTNFTLILEDDDPHPHTWQTDSEGRVVSINRAPNFARKKKG